MLATELKVGTIFKDGKEPVVVEKYEHTKTARGGATVKVRARSLVTTQIKNKNYQSHDRIEDADVMRKNVQYIYRDDNYNFMDPVSFEQFSIPAKIIGDQAKYFIEGASVQVLFFEGSPVSIELPNSMEFEVIETVPGFKGNTVSNVLKEATLSNSTVVKVPTFIKAGDRVKIDTRTGAYVSKA